MSWNLDSYGDFEEEQRLLAAESKKKEEQEQSKIIEQTEITYRFKCICGYFLRLSWKHKEKFLLSFIEKINCCDSLARLVSYLSMFHGKMAAYSDVSRHCKVPYHQVIIDHDRSIEIDFLKDVVCEDLNWLTSLPLPRQVFMFMGFLQMSGGGLLKKIYLPIIKIYNRKVKEQEQLRNEQIQTDELKDVFNDAVDRNDSDIYPRDHPLTIEVEKMRKKWDEAIEKYRRDLFGYVKETKKKAKKDDAEKPTKKLKTKETSEKKVKASKKPKTDKKGSKGANDSVDWIQMLPIWIIKKILNYLDQKDLQSFKKVNHYWSYVCDSLIKDIQARVFLNSTLQKMISNVDPEILKEHRQAEGLLSKLPHKPDSPREKRFKKLMNRGTVLHDMQPTVKKANQTVGVCLLTSITSDICEPIQKAHTFPRFIKDDLILYQDYPCILKDVDILIDVSENIRQQRGTLSYTLSQQLSDTFSMSEANLADW